MSNMETTSTEIANPEFRRLLADRIRALADPTRIHLLHCLMQEECCVRELAAQVGKSQATVSKHLAILFRHGYVAQRKDGVQTFYRVEGEGLNFFCQYMCGSLKEHLKKMAVYGLEPVFRG
ncbi:MAG: metalloregulator ArsR/SmtB family transcription factor [bacterium]|nr:metalloregulator ArsR/SmtB family transcription factor [bacterium]